VPVDEPRKAASAGPGRLQTPSRLTWRVQLSTAYRASCLLVSPKDSAQSSASQRAISTTMRSEARPSQPSGLRCSLSDLVSNATRGRLAEFIVAQALNVDTSGVRDEWAAYDLLTSSGIKVEVKSAAYLQSWAQRRHSNILCSDHLHRERLFCYHEAVKVLSDTLRRDAWMNTICACPLWSPWLRRRFLAWAGLQVAPSARINPRCFFGGANVSIGANTFVNWGCFFDNNGSITIGNDCLIGMGVYFVTSHHEGHSVIGKPIIVGDGCWIGARCIILPGVRIAPGCVVGAGSVVTSELEPGKYAGNPARLITTSSSVVR